MEDLAGTAECGRLAGWSPYLYLHLPVHTCVPLPFPAFSCVPVFTWLRLCTPGSDLISLGKSHPSLCLSFPPVSWRDGLGHFTRAAYEPFSEEVLASWVPNETPLLGTDRRGLLPNAVSLCVHLSHRI